jgi:hypothetical protein
VLALDNLKEADQFVSFFLSIQEFENKKKLIESNPKENLIPITIQDSSPIFLEFGQLRSEEPNFFES